MEQERKNYGRFRAGISDNFWILVRINNGRFRVLNITDYIRER